MDSKLRVGLLLDSIFLPAWALTAIERMVVSNAAEIVLVILNQSRPQSCSSPTIFRSDCRHWLYHFFNLIDEKLFISWPSASIPVDSTPLFSGVPFLEVTPVDQETEQHILAFDVEQIKAYDLDILVKLGFANLRGDILLAARYGVWTYRWGDHRKIEDGLTGFWEVVEKWPETGASLWQVGIDPKHDQLLFETWFFTYPYSPARSRNYILWSAASFLPRQIERLHRSGEKEFFQGVQRKPLNESPSLPKANAIPSNFAALWIMARLAARNLLELYRRNFCRERWELLFHFGANVKHDISLFQKISPPVDRFWADPHVIYQEPNYYIFVEEYLYQTKRGHISVIEMDQKGNCRKPIQVLQKDYHLSFPFVFDWQGRYFMIPESSENKTIDLYECTRFPDRWQYKHTLMKDVKAVDTTLLFFQGKWWLFTAMAEQEAASPQVELFLFYSDELFAEEWRAHPMNPIVSDMKRARAAGRIFSKDGKLFRPSQDCSKTYGYGFDLNEIIALSETEYYERPVISVRPDRVKNVIATHTYSNQENLTVIDALTRPLKWARTA
jgi:hypothetical protein